MDRSPFPWDWRMADGYPAKGARYHGLKVFSTFACGGGSTMGYKLAGYDVVGANDIDPQMAEVYKANHHPRFYFQMPVKEMLTAELPDELYNLDVLDGSPPCSSFSMAGAREKHWGKKKKFREGQASQVLDDLFFDWVALVDKLRPRVAIAENVRGMLAGRAREYTLEVKRALLQAGYVPQLFIMNGSHLGVPQARERIFFIATRNDLALPGVRLEFNIPPVTAGEVASRCANDGKGRPLSPAYRQWWARMGTDYGSFNNHHPTGSFFNTRKLHPGKVTNTIAASSGSKQTHWDSPHEVSDEFYALCGTFPRDYDYLKVDPKYLIGMSVPPVMMAQVALQVYQQVLGGGSPK